MTEITDVSWCLFDTHECSKYTHHNQLCQLDYAIVSPLQLAIWQRLVIGFIADDIGVASLVMTTRVEYDWDTEAVTYTHR